MNLKSSSQIFIIILLLLLAFFAGRWSKSNNEKGAEKKTKIDISIAAIQEIAKLATIEMPVSELINHEKFYGYDWDFLKGRALVRAKGNVVAGYDLQEIDIRIDSLEKIIYFNKSPQAKILFVETDISYFDIQEGLFFSFEKEDYNEIQRLGKEAVIEAAMKIGIEKKAQEKFNQLMLMFQKTIKQSGWKLEYESGRISPPQLR